MCRARMFDGVDDAMKGFEREARLALHGRPTDLVIGLPLGMGDVIDKMVVRDAGETSASPVAAMSEGVPHGRDHHNVGEIGRRTV